MLKTMIGATGLALFMLALHGSGASAAYPERSITMLVGFGAGAGTDIVARKIGIELEKALGQSVVVVNKAGGGGLVSWKELAASFGDGDTRGPVITDVGPVHLWVQTRTRLRDRP